MTATERTRKKLAELKDILQDGGTMLIVLQDDPDPDALASAVALRKLANTFSGMQCSIGCDGEIGRAENRAMARYLGLNLRSLAELDVRRFDLLAMVDTQPGTSNNSLPAGVRPDIVIDHHPFRRQTRQVRFTDIRSRYGATSTILLEYLSAAGIVPETALATALLYGIRSDTQDFGRETTQADIEAFGRLYPLANMRMLGAIQRGRVPTEYFQMLAGALAAARLCGSCIYCDMGGVDNPSMIAELADLFLRHEGVEWSLCWGYCNGQAMLSARCLAADRPADEVIRAVVRRKGTGGGHRSMAAGRIPLKDDCPTARRKLSALIRRRFAAATGNDLAAARRLVGPPPNG